MKNITKKGKKQKNYLASAEPLHHPFLIGKRLYLRGLEKEDLKGNMFQWANDAEVTHYMFTGARPNSLELLEEEYARMIRSPNDIVFAIVDRRTHAHIGIAGLYVIHWIARTAEYRILIGEKAFWDQGYGQETARLILQYGFEKLNLNKIWLGVNAEHQRAIRSYEKSGFQREGVLRQEIYRNGRYYDAVRMSILRTEYDAMASFKI